MLGLVGTVAAIGTVGATTSVAADEGEPSLNAQAIRGYWAATAASDNGNGGPN